MARKILVDAQDVRKEGTYGMGVEGLGLKLVVGDLVGFPVLVVGLEQLLPRLLSRKASIEGSENDPVMDKNVLCQ